MTPTQIHVCECVFNLPLVNISQKTVILLSKIKFDSEGKMSTREHLIQFVDKCLHYFVTNDHVL